MYGMDQATGLGIPANKHLEQSIAHILQTPKGSVVGQRDYGSDLWLLLDRPINSITKMEVYSAVASALQQWEPRFVLQQVTLAPQENGIELSILGENLQDRVHLRTQVAL
jgi:phage baseplate assembly protein W